MHTWHPVGVDRDPVLVSLLVLRFQSADVLWRQESSGWILPWHSQHPLPALQDRTLPLPKGFVMVLQPSGSWKHHPSGQGLVGSTALCYQRTWGGRGTGILQALPGVSMWCCVGFVQLGTHRVSKPRWAQGMVRVRAQQEGKMNGFSKNPHHHLTGFSFIYMIFLLAVTNNGCAYPTPRVINNFSPGAIFLKHWHVRSLYIGLCSKSQF